MIAAALRCRHFGVCGGCTLQDLDYSLQLESKKSEFERLLSALGVPLFDFVPAPDPWNYRNKVELSFLPPRLAAGGPPGSLTLGFKEKGKWYRGFDLAECLIFDPFLARLGESVRLWAIHENCAAYDPRRHHGFLRHLAVRKGATIERKGAFLATLVTSSQRELPGQSLIERLSSIKNDLFELSLFHGVNDSWADTAVPQRIETLSGRPYLYEYVLGRPFRYSLGSFFQTNPRAFELLLGEIAAHVGRLGVSCVLDCYCGVGVMAVMLAERCGCPAVGIESVVSSIDDARVNAGNQNGDRLTFVLAQVEDVLSDWLKKPEIRSGAVILDPPRSGLHPKALKALAADPPAHLIYVSCNPKRTVEADLPHLSQSYKITRAQAFDFFPQTRHYEALFFLQRI
ncbi:MAG: 23S rRNA (uracil(1939)-C(5))-methyltransferase RlmD [Elusimicrobia bacterium]|nr:23S rRNA (uracil(1939)-C(5))-methyltransferase RlmD [Elusimicrobiota bacterium]